MSTDLGGLGGLPRTAVQAEVEEQGERRMLFVGAKGRR